MGTPMEAVAGSGGSLMTWSLGGARRDRTADLLHAMQALSQLSYGPTNRIANFRVLGAGYQGLTRPARPVPGNGSQPSSS
jgi:hypothetical protein